MRIEDLEPIRELAEAAKTLSMRYESIDFTASWLRKERGGVVPDLRARELDEARDRLLAAARMVEGRE